MLELITDPLSSLLFPRLCRSCRVNHVGSGTDLACTDCWSKTQAVSGSDSICAKCGLILGRGRNVGQQSCWQCDDHRYDHARSLGVYSHALAAEVIALKSTPTLSGMARKVLRDRWPAIGFLEMDLVVPVPLSKRRSLERGYNQAAVIALFISRHINVPIDGISLLRKHHSPLHRIGMDKKARDVSVKNAFEIQRPNLIAGKRILLVDDVYTTGATVSYCAKELKKAGASAVEVFTLARAVLRS